jgi:glycosyltransferase involved in cell wall biosynthesis
VRVGLVGPLPPPPGGMANQTRQLAALLQAEGIEVDRVRTNEPYWRPIGAIRGVRALFRGVPYLRRLTQMAREADVAHVMANSGWSWHLFAAPAVTVCALRGVPVIINYRGGLAREFLSGSSWIVLPALRRAKAVIVPSRFLQEVFAPFGIQAEIIPNGVDLDIFRPAPQSQRKQFRIVVTRNLERIYGIDVALRAIALLRHEYPELKVTIAGEGPERGALERQVAQLELSGCVRITGALDTGSVASLYHEADLMLNPSRADNTPNALIEAAACGVPIVSTDVGGIPYLVEHGRNAWLVASEDPEAMAAGVRLVLTDAALRDTLRVNGLVLAQSCSWETVRRRWISVYQRIAGQDSVGQHAPVGLEK